MESLYVVEPGSYLRIAGHGLRIVKDGTVLSEIPAKGLERLTLVGRCSMTGSVLDFLIRNKIETVFMTHSGRFRARLLLDGTGHVNIRMVQYRRLSDERFKVRTAASIVASKLKRQGVLLLKRAYRSRDSRLRELSLQLTMLAERAENSGDLEEIRGIEGYGARLYYGGFGMLILNDEFRFEGRNKRPPRDPVNALLSFIYTLFTNELLSAIKAVGLDPYLGALHEPLRGRPSLACDLVEEWRPLADAFVLNVINRRLVKREDFVFMHGDERPVEMTPSLLRTFIEAYERKMSRPVIMDGESMKLRWGIHRRVRWFADYLREKEPRWHPLNLKER